MVAVRPAVALAGALVLVVGPAGPAAAAGPVTVTARGALELTVADGFDHGHAVERAAVRVGGAAVAVPRQQVAGVPGDSTVELTLRTRGGRTGAALASAVAAGEAAVTGVRVLSTARAAAATGTHQVTLVPMYWTTATVPAGEPSSAELAEAVGDVDAYYDEVTDGALRVAAYRTLPWTKIAMPAGASCDTQTGTARSEALRLAGTMVASPLHHLVAYFPPAPGCGWGGLATIGSGWGSYGTIWLNSYADVRVFAHELGHNLGLHHSGGLRCTAGGAAVTLSESCTIAAYDDPWDIMGSSPYGRVGHLSAARLAQLGALPALARREVAVGAQVRLAPVGAAAGVRSVVVPVGTRTYHLEYRTPAGLDHWIDDLQYLGAGGGTGSRYPGGGLVVRRVDSALPSGQNQMYAVLDFHPTWAADVRGLGAGEQWVSADGGIGFRVDAADDSGATVTVLRPQDVSGPSIAVTYPAANAALGGAFATSWSASDAGSGIETVTVELDGVPVEEVTRAGGEMPTSAYLDDVPDGAHTLRLRAVDAAGNASLSAGVPIDVDGVDPAVAPAPRAVLAPGTTSATAVPVTVQWGAADSSGICAQTVTRVPGVSAWPSTSARALVGTLRPGEATYWSMAAYDCRGNGRVVAGAPVTASLDVQSTTRGYAGAWATARSTRHLGGSERVSGTPGSAFTYTTTARAVGLVAARGPTRGRAAVYVDGRRITTVDLYAPGATYRQQVFTHSWAAAGRHTVKIVNSSAGSRRTVGVDAVTRLS
ncbi:MAG TPA: Ig-like domain-containing protein [Pilimelia sp.]|nr:Ig-like domain-containing protein [Pilimelia sp.]